jgi:hypothetical protein
MSKKVPNLYLRNVRLARKLWGPQMGDFLLKALKGLSEQLRLDLASGDLLLLDGRWYVTHAGLLRMARRKKCSGISVEAVAGLCDSAAARFVVKATAYPSKASSGFVAFGDADPSNVSPLVRGAETPLASRSKTSSSSSLTGQRKTAMPCFASSTATPARSRRWSHEAPSPRSR